MILEFEKPKILVIVGPTASGKTALAIKLAKGFNGEVISADSRQVYRGLDMGTGKVTIKEMGGIPHHLLDIVDPGSTYTAAQFKEDGAQAITDISSRGKLPIIAGGTFFFVDALLGKNSFPEVEPNQTLRAELEKLNTETLFAQLTKKDPTRAAGIDQNNRRRLIRALEIIETLGTVPKTKTYTPYNFLTMGITLPKDALRKKIHTRLIERLDQGMIEEVSALRTKKVSDEWLTRLGLEYRYITEYLQGKLSKDELITVLDAKIWQYAKRQMTWLKRDTNIVWMDTNTYDAIHEKVSDFLSK